MIEVGVPNFISDTWNAISAPPKTPAPIIAKLNRTINEIIGEAGDQGPVQRAQPHPGRRQPADMAKLKKEETERWSKVIRDAGIQPE